VRAVLDANVLISAVLSSRRASAELLRGGRDGAFELIVSRLLLAEPDRAVAYPKVRKRICSASNLGWPDALAERKPR
jgi:predicted nucleic acid-binding protein